MSVRGASRELAMALGLPFKDLPRVTILSSLERKKKRGKSTPVAIEDKTNLLFLQHRSSNLPISGFHRSSLCKRKLTF